ncbi:uncharacterized protein V1513DRAFT_430170 [Lipomyces chichibuensis]|uniref:uncharacterized protein n=1 Tax=Lipomyces chichibuensis TaxID=1546026 RepID=UPI003343A37B
MPSSSSSSAEKSTTSSVINLPSTARVASTRIADPRKVAKAKPIYRGNESESRPTLYSASDGVITRAGVPIRKPGQTVEGLIRERREQLVYRSGVADSDTELKQALDIFMQRYNEVEQENNDLYARKEEMAETKRRTKVIRDQMMQGRQRFDDDPDDDSASLSDQLSARRKKHSKISRNELEAEIYQVDKKLTEQIHGVDMKLTELSEKVVDSYSSIQEDIKKLLGK